MSCFTSSLEGRVVPNPAACVNPNCGRQFLNEDRIIDGRHAACAQYLRRNHRERPRYLILEQDRREDAKWLEESWARHQAQEEADAELWLTHRCYGCDHDIQCAQPTPRGNCPSGYHCKVLNTRGLCSACANKRNKKGYDPTPDTFTMPEHFDPPSRFDHHDPALENHAYVGDDTSGLCKRCGHQRRDHAAGTFAEEDEFAVRDTCRPQNHAYVDVDKLGTCDFCGDPPEDHVYPV
jgi:hypothetical protein